MARVLIVDDHRLIGAVLVDFLELRGHKAFSVGTLAEARGLIGEGQIDLIVMDMMLPDGNGHHFAQSVQANPETKEIPIVLMSAHCKAERDVDGNCFDYLEKPFDLMELERRIADLTKRPSPVALDLTPERIS